MRALWSERQPTGQGDCSRQPCVPTHPTIILPEFVRYHRSLAPCVLNHGVLVLLDCLTYSLHLAICVTCCSYPVPPKSPPYHHPRCMLAICITFIILFMFNAAFPKKQVYPCTRCKLDFHLSQLGPNSLCERCFTKICSQSDGVALRGCCIDALDDGTVDPNNL